MVPPLATKSVYYGNPLTRQLWQDAYDALRSASRITLVGYSLPVADVVVAGMLRSAISGQHVQLEIVNRDPGDLCTRFATIAGRTGEGEGPFRWIGTSRLAESLFKLKWRMRFRRRPERGGGAWPAMIRLA